jgi:hypothetical protein
MRSRHLNGEQVFEKNEDMVDQEKVVAAGEPLNKDLVDIDKELT